MTAEIIPLQPYIDTRNFLIRHYHDAVRLSQKYYTDKPELSLKWFIAAQGIAIKLNAMGVTI